jgi:hypothetical protein
MDGLVTYPVRYAGKNVCMAHILYYTSGKRRAVMPTFREWVQEYLEGAGKMRKAASERDRSLLREAVRAWNDRPLDRIKRSDCEGLLRSMLSFNVAFGTAWLRCIRTRLLFKLAVDEGLLTENPWSGVMLPKPTGRGRVLTRAEELQLTGRLGPGWGRLLTVAVGTGLRARRCAGDAGVDADLPRSADGSGRRGPGSGRRARRTPEDLYARSAALRGLSHQEADPLHDSPLTIASRFKTEGSVGLQPDRGAFETISRRYNVDV